MNYRQPALKPCRPKWNAQCQLFGTDPGYFPQSIYGNPFYAADSPVRKALFAATTPRYYLPNDMGIHEDSPIPYTNSNTFARYVLNQAAISWQSIGVSDFQGLALPQDVTGTWSTPVER